MWRRLLNELLYILALCRTDRQTGLLCQYRALHFSASSGKNGSRHNVVRSLMTDILHCIVLIFALTFVTFAGA